MYTCRPGDDLWCRWMGRALPGEESELKYDTSVESIKGDKFIQVAICPLPPLNSTLALIGLILEC